METMDKNKDKNFNEWNELKKRLHIRNEEILFHEREIWWCSLGVNVFVNKSAPLREPRRPKPFIL